MPPKASKTSSTSSTRSIQRERPPSGPATPAPLPHESRYERVRLHDADCVLAEHPQIGGHLGGWNIAQPIGSYWQAYLALPDDHPWGVLPDRNLLLPPAASSVQTPRGPGHQRWPDLSRAGRWFVFGGDTKRNVLWLAREAASAMWWAHPSRMTAADLTPYLLSRDPSIREYATVHLAPHVSAPSAIASSPLGSAPASAPPIVGAWEMTRLSGVAFGELLRDAEGTHYWRTEGGFPARPSALPWAWCKAQMTRWPRDVARPGRDCFVLRPHYPWYPELDAEIGRDLIPFRRAKPLQPPEPINRP